MYLQLALYCIKKISVIFFSNYYIFKIRIPTRRKSKKLSFLGGFSQGRQHRRRLGGPAIIDAVLEQRWQQRRRQSFRPSVGSRESSERRQRGGLVGRDGRCHRSRDHETMGDGFHRQRTVGSTHAAVSLSKVIYIYYIYLSI